MSVSKKSTSSQQPEIRWESARSHTSSELLAILAPTADEPRAIRRAGVWKTGTPAPESAV